MPTNDPYSYTYRNPTRMARERPEYQLQDDDASPYMIAEGTEDPARQAAIQNYYRQYLGRDYDEPGYQGWYNSPMTLQEIEQGIRSSPEAVGRQQASAGTRDWSAGPWDANRVREFFGSRGVTPRETSPDYWAQRWQEWGQRDPAYFLRRLNEAEEFGGGAGGAQNAWNDPDTRRWMDQLNQVFSRFNQPINNPDFQPMVDYLRQYMQQLQGPAYTPSQMELMQTQSLNPLEHQRTAARQQVQQRLASKGIQGGLAERAMQEVDRQFNQMRTNTQSQFANAGIEAERAQRAQAAQVGTTLNALQNQQSGLNDQRMLQALGLLNQPVQLANQRVGMANAMIQPMNPASYLQQFMQQQQQNQGQNQQFWANVFNALSGIF